MLKHRKVSKYYEGGCSKTDYLRKICSKSPIGILCIDEAKLDSRCSIWNPDAQLEISDYQYPPCRKDRNKNGGIKIVLIREDLITKKLKAFEGDISETICLEINISMLCLSISI